MSSIGGTFHFDHIIASGYGQANSGQGLTGTALGTALNLHTKHLGGRSKFAQGVSQLQQTDPSFVKTLQSNVRSAITQAKANGQTGDAIGQAIQSAIQTTFKNASPSDQSAINAAFGASIYDSNGNFNASALQSIFSGRQPGSTTVTPVSAPSNSINVTTSSVAPPSTSTNDALTPIAPPNPSTNDALTPTAPPNPSTNDALTPIAPPSITTNDPAGPIAPPSFTSNDPVAPTSGPGTVDNVVISGTPNLVDPTATLVDATNGLYAVGLQGQNGNLQLGLRPGQVSADPIPSTTAASGTGIDTISSFLASNNYPTGLSALGNPVSVTSSDPLNISA
jgi:hypothetical protein